MLKNRISVLLVFIAALFVIQAPVASASYTTLTMWDHVYYDTAVVNSTDAYTVCGPSGGLYATYDWLPRGTVLTVRPNQSGVTYGATAENQVIANQVRVIVITGVGSSPLGTLATAKQVANILNQPVAGIISGQGGWELSYDVWIGMVNGSTNKWNSFSSGAYVPGVISSDKLYSLYSRGARPKLVVGHSKGVWDYINALWHMNNTGYSSWFTDTKFVAFGMNGIVPSGTTWRAYIGTLDTLGNLNKNTNVNLTMVSGKKHSINRHALDSTLVLTYPAVVPEGDPATAMPIETYLLQAVAAMGVTF
jgi:hypothetical protein